jgi:ABC-type uncharacterized transport system permease subunit
MQRTWKKEALTDVVNLALGVWLFLSPWIFGFDSETAASWNAWLSGIVVAGLAVAALAAFAEWEKWLNLIVGLWVAVSPWVVGFAANARAARDHLVVGVIVAVVAAVRLWFVRQGPPHVTA